MAGDVDRDVHAQVGISQGLQILLKPGSMFCEMVKTIRSYFLGLEVNSPIRRTAHTNSID